MMSATREILPSARRLIGSLRDIGYDLSSALADLVDNSLTAGATRVEVDMRFAGVDSWIRVADNGAGMTRSELDEALRFGTRREYRSDDLGRYGLGLKLATLSQCRLLTVASRGTPNGRLSVAQWDLQHVEITDRWEILRPSAASMDSLVTEPLANSTGTVVFMDELDRVLRYASPDGTRAEQAFVRASQEIEAHLGMVFHRFLAGEAVRPRPFSIHLNGRRIEAWDPFSRDEPATLAIPPRTLHLETDDGRVGVEVRPYILPVEAAFSSPTNHQLAGGPRRWNRQQGLYIYRNDRLIQSGGWSRLRTPDEHTKLARVSIDFPAVLDGYFALNVAKSQARIPSALRDDLNQIVSGVAQLAQRAYRSSSAAGAHGAAPESKSAKTHDARASTLLALVDLVIEGGTQALSDELGEDALTLRRAVRVLRSMRGQFAADLDALISGKTSQRGSDAVAGD